MTTQGLFEDIRYALRQARRAPGFAIAAVATMALGVGASIGVFTLVDAVALRALPYREPTRLMAIWETHLERGLTHEPLSPVNALDYRALSNDFVDVAAWWRPEVTLSDAATASSLAPVRTLALVSEPCEKL